MNHKCPIRFSAGRECGESGYGRHQAVIVQSEFNLDKQAEMEQ